MKTRIAYLLGLLLLAFSLVAGTASAQCLMPDNLEGTCCAPASADLPTFPDLDVGVKYICWRNCDVNLDVNLLTKVKHMPVGCGLSLIRFDITNASGMVDIWKGKLIGSYSRTWMEISPTSSVPNTQVWRWLVNGDFQIDPAIVTAYGSNPCVVPPSYAVYNRILVTGYVDYAYNCDTNTWSIAYALGHECDLFEHDNTFSNRPGSFGNARSYSWVAPAAGFVPNPLLPIAEGSIVNDGIRDYDFSMPLANICTAEQPVAQGNHFKTDEYCPCLSANALPQFTISRLNAVSICGTSVSSITEGIWPGHLSKSIGRWTDPTTYPGTESLHLQQGFFAYQDGCTGIDNRYYMKGVQTQGGYDVLDFEGTILVPVSNRLIDLGSAIPLSLNPFTPAVGRRYVSDRMVYLNVD